MPAHPQSTHRHKHVFVFLCTLSPRCAMVILALARSSPHAVHTRTHRALPHCHQAISITPCHSHHILKDPPCFFFASLSFSLSLSLHSSPHSLSFHSFAHSPLVHPPPTCTYSHSGGTTHYTAQFSTLHFEFTTLHIHTSQWPSYEVQLDAHWPSSLASSSSLSSSP